MAPRDPPEFRDDFGPPCDLPPEFREPVPSRDKDPSEFRICVATPLLPGGTWGGGPIGTVGPGDAISTAGREIDLAAIADPPEFQEPVRSDNP